MNAIAIKERIDFYNDRVRSARFPRYNYDQAFNDAIRIFIEDRIGTKKKQQLYSFESMQQVRDELYTLIKVQTGAPTLSGTVTNQYFSHQKSTITFAADYYFLVQLQNTIDGYSDYGRPTTYNELGPLLQNSFRHPSNTKTYYVENATGLDIYWSTTGTFSSSSLTYLKRPATFTIGADTQLIAPGAAVLTAGISYIACDVSVSNSVTYQPGQQFIANVASLTSGSVILESDTLTTDLPLKCQEELCRVASELMLGNISDFNKSSFSEKSASQM